MTFMVGLSPKTKPAVRRIFAIVLIIIAVIVFLWVLIVNPFLNRQEKNRFEAAYAELESLSKQIQEKTGTPESIETDKSCGYSSAKFSRGHRSCTVKSDIRYTDVTFDTANSIMSNAEPLVGTDLRFGLVNSHQSVFEKNERKEQRFIQQFYSNELRCSVEYVLLASYNLEETNDLTLNLSCGGPARAEHYPVEE